MPVNVSCPACNNRGVVPDDTPPDATLTCRACGHDFPVGSSGADAVAPVLAGDPMAVWVGAPAANPLLAAPLVAGPIPSDPTPARPTPPDITPENAAAHLEWLRAETARFQSYVDKQFEAVGKMREQVMAFENKTRAEWVRKEQAIARDRAILNARAKELAAQEGNKAAGLPPPAQDLQAELDRRVEAERENLARRAEALARSEQEMERWVKEMNEVEERVRRGQAELQQLHTENALLRSAAQRDAMAVAELQGRLADADNRHTALAGQAAEADRQRAEVERLRLEVRGLQGENAELRAVRAKADEQAAELASIRAENEALRGQLADAVERSAVADERLRAEGVSAAEAERLRAENADLRASLAGANERSAALAEQAAEQSRTVERMTAAGQRLIKQRDELKAKLQDAQRRADPSAG